MAAIMEAEVIYMSKKKKVPLTRRELYSGAVSATECTGLTATVPETEAEAESYRDIANVPVTPDDGCVRHRKKNGEEEN